MAKQSGTAFTVGKVTYFYNSINDIKTLYGSPTSKEDAYTKAYQAVISLDLSKAKAVNAGASAKAAYLKAELYNQSTPVLKFKVPEQDEVIESYNAAFYYIDKMGIYSVLDNKGASFTGTDYNDYIVGLNGADTITTGKGNDYLYAGNGANTVNGGEGDDTIVTRTGTYTSQIVNTIPQIDRPYHKTGIAISEVKKSSYAGDVVYDGTGNDFIDTGIGDDQIYLGSGNNQILSGLGNDHIYLDTASYDTSTPLELSRRKAEKILIRTEDGDDIISLGDTLGNVMHDTSKLYDGLSLGNISYTIVVNTDKQYLLNKVWTSFLQSYVYDYQYKGKLTIYTGSGSDIVQAGAGDDIIYTEAGNDTVLAGAGKDFIDAGDGDDLVVTGPGADTVYLGEGVDNIYVSFGDTIAFTAKDGKRDTIKIDPLILDYEEGIIVESQFLPVETTANGTKTIAIEQVPIQRLGKIVIKYPESKSALNTNEMFLKNKVDYLAYLQNVVGLTDIGSGKTDYSAYLHKGAKSYQDFLDLNPLYDQIDLSELFEKKNITTYNVDVPADKSSLDLSGLSGALPGDYIKYGQSYITVKDLTAGISKINTSKTNISQLTDVELRKLMGILSSKNMLQEKDGEVMLNIPIPNGAIVDVIEVHIIGVNLAEASQMLVL